MEQQNNKTGNEGRGASTLMRGLAPREIKFRAWDEKDEVMTDPFEIWNGRLSVEGEHHVAFKKDLTLMQFTGLKDKNGNEIYEGDICLFIDSYADEVRTHETEYVAIVKWIEEKASFMYAFQPNEFEMIFMDDNTEMEVIGNIFENPELIP